MGETLSGENSTCSTDLTIVIRFREACTVENMFVCKTGFSVVSLRACVVFLTNEFFH